MILEKELSGWGVVTKDGEEIWDTKPVFLRPTVSFLDEVKLIFYPKKLVLYRRLRRAARQADPARPFRILDVGCGTGAAAIDLKKFCGPHTEVTGVDVVDIQVAAAQEKAARFGVPASFLLYPGDRLPFPDASFDAVYTSDVLGHVENVPQWLGELARVLKPGGTLAMYSESSVGRHAFIRRYLMFRGVNTDPHARFHISLYPKKDLCRMVEERGFGIERVYSPFWGAFFVHPQEFASALRTTWRFPVLRLLNALLCGVQRLFGRLAVAAGELYGTLEMYTLGRWVEGQGYIILAKKR